MNKLTMCMVFFFNYDISINAHKSCHYCNNVEQVSPCKDDAEAADLLGYDLVLK